MRARLLKAWQLLGESSGSSRAGGARLRADGVRAAGRRQSRPDPAMSDRQPTDLLRRCDRRALPARRCGSLDDQRRRQVFSITIAALTLAACQMGPRLLRNSTRDHGNQLTLGVDLGTFCYDGLRSATARIARYRRVSAWIRPCPPPARSGSASAGAAGCRGACRDRGRLRRSADRRGSRRSGWRRGSPRAR